MTQRVNKQFNICKKVLGQTLLKECCVEIEKALEFLCNKKMVILVSYLHQGRNDTRLEYPPFGKVCRKTS